MKKYLITVMMVMITIISVNAQYGNQDYANNDDRYYYDNDFDWHWDIRVKISNGIQQGLLTQNESNRLYGILEDMERKEYAYQADGIFSSWEQQEIWDNVIYLNQRLGIELNDYDRNFYGFDVFGYDRREYNKWFYQGGYDFNRFDKRGFGSIRIGYAPRPNYYGWYRNNNNRIAQRYYSDRRYYDNRGNNQRFERDNRDNRNFGNQYDRGSRGYADNNRNRPSGNDYGRNSQGNNGNNRNDRSQIPNNRSNGNGGYSQGNGGGRPERVEPNNNGGTPQGNGGGRPERAEPNNRSDNGNRDGSNRSETPQSGGNTGRRGPR